MLYMCVMRTIGGPEVGLLADAGLSTLMGADPLGKCNEHIQSPCISRNTLYWHMLVCMQRVYDSCSH